MWGGSGGDMGWHIPLLRDVAPGGPWRILRWHSKSNVEFMLHNAPHSSTMWSAAYTA